MDTQLEDSADEFFTPVETARYARISVNTTYQLLAAGELPGVRVGRQWRTSRRKLDAYLAGAR